MRTPESELAALRANALLRSLHPLASGQAPTVSRDGRTLVNFSSNDYLGLATSGVLKQAATRAITDYGTGSGASRLISGTLPPHRLLEEKLATLKNTAAALTFSTGYATAVGTLTALLTSGDIVIVDKLAHACLIDGARLSGATLRVFPHNELDKLASHLTWARRKATADARVLVVTESVFSMDGDRAPLLEIASLTKQYDALLLVDEAHAFGTVG
ncbi:MAG: aminotransferase class I/II-fold pyridoxal phosphate-dependent enzyme, partial [Verrucomicrobiales bacterium]|nr:aminotransferase class I/II-fold pyridoxal phosphate-dependent enzyme [Verrucomicrobiales bacterium]